MMKHSLATFCVAAVFCINGLLCSDTSHAQQADWPQWRGPNRDGHAAKQNLLQEWPEGGPKLKWQFNDTGRGFSTLSVVDGKLFTLGANDETCNVLCIDANTGELIWSKPIGRVDKDKDYNRGWGGGPRSAPTVDGEGVFAMTDLGVVANLNITSGDVVWTADLVEDHGGKIPTWGYSESPLVDGDRVVVTPGGKNFMIALDRKTGEKVWSSEGYNEGAQYVSVMRGTQDDQPFYVTASKKGLVGSDTQTGKMLFTDSATGNKTAVIPTPILKDNFLYHSSAYGAGNSLLSLRKSDNGIAATSEYALQGKTMENHHGGVVLSDGVIYGFTKANGGNWMAQELTTGKTLWEEKIRPNRSGSICMADGRLYCYNDKDGSVILVEPSRIGFQQKGILTLPKQTDIPRGKGAIWAHPIIANQTLFIRDQDLIFAYDLRR